MQLWIIAMSALNFATAYFVLSRLFRFGTLAAAFGAFLFSFGAVRVNQLGHEQLVPQFYTLLALYGLGRALETAWEVGAQWKTAGHLGLFAACSALQFWAGFYLAWFFGVALVLAVPWALAFRESREAGWRLVHRHPLAIVGGAALGVLMLLPAATTYLAAGRQVGMRDYGEVTTMLPRLSSWIDMGPWSWLYGRLNETGLFDSIPMEHEHRLGVGFVTPLLCLAGLFFLWRNVAVRVVVLAMLTFVVIGMWWPILGAHASAWKMVYQHVPGAGAIRAVSRFGILVLLPLSLGLAGVVKRLQGWKAKERWGALAAVGAVVALEQGLTTPSFDKERAYGDAAEIARRVDTSCKAFFYAPIGSRAPYFKHQLDAMSAQMIARVPTVNGYSGFNPPNWFLEHVNMRSPIDQPRVDAALKHWAAANGIDASGICRVYFQPGLDAPNHAVFVAQSVPPRMKAGAPQRVSLTFRNQGYESWRRAAWHRLGAAGATRAWGLERVYLERSVKPGEEYTFEFEVTAPPQPGTYQFSWRMVQEVVEWFGEPSPPVAIEVVP
ncbi:MAG: NBR1-Ig-like domain-containing protein [Myxococcota bacterium]